MAPHPVWQVYNELRTARLNVKYYQCLLEHWRNRNFWTEIPLAVTASSTLAGMAFFSTALGGAIWQVFGAAAAALSIYRPVAGVTQKVGALEETVTKWKTVEVAFSELKRRIERDAALSEQVVENFETVMTEVKSLQVQLSKMPGGIDETLRKKCEEEVNQELPVGSFFVPGDQP